MFERTKAVTAAARAAAKTFFSSVAMNFNAPRSKPDAPLDLIGIINSLPISHLRDYESYLWAGSRKVWACWKACDIVAKIVMDTPRVLVLAGGDTSEVEDKGLSPILIQANPFETFGEFLARMVFHLQLTGNAFIAKDSPNFNGDQPTALYALNPRRIILQLNNRGIVQGYTYIVGNGQVVPFDVNEVIHVKTTHPDRDYWGLGPVEASEDLFNDFINRQTWLEKFWSNGAAPSGIMFLKTSQVTNRDDWEMMKKKFQSEYGGAENSGKTAFLTGDWGYQPLGMTARDMQSIESATWSVEQVFLAMGIPLTVAGIKNASNFATADVDDLRLRRYTVKPLVNLISDKFNLDLVAGFDPKKRLLFKVQGLIDIEGISRSFPPLLETGVLSLNEGRALLGFPHIDDPMYDQHYVTANLVPLELAGLVAQEPQVQQQAQNITKKFRDKLLKRKENKNNLPLDAGNGS